MVLLGMKKRGFGAGRWNGFGGKVIDGESIKSAAQREVLEETGLAIKHIEKIGVINFKFQDGSPGVEAHIFKAIDFDGKLIASEEMKPKWFHVNNLPFQEMWPADAYWLPLLLNGKKFQGKFLYDRPSTNERASVIIEKSLWEVKTLKMW